MQKRLIRSTRKASVFRKVTALNGNRIVISPLHRIGNLLPGDALYNLPVIPDNKVRACRRLLGILQIFKIIPVLLRRGPRIGRVVDKDIFHLLQCLPRPGIWILRQQHFHNLRRINRLSCSFSNDFVDSKAQSHPKEQYHKKSNTAGQICPSPLLLLPVLPLSSAHSSAHPLRFLWLSFTRTLLPQNPFFFPVTFCVRSCQHPSSFRSPSNADPFQIYDLPTGAGSSPSLS